MIRLGYPDCASCHVSPQGGGPLNAYGRGVDRAQSLRGGEYEAAADGLARLFSFGGRTAQDLRLVLQAQRSNTGSGAAQSHLWPRLAYRNVTDIGAHVRVAATITAETESALRPVLPYETPARASSVFVNTALVYYRASPALQFAAGRDQLPSGLNVPDLGLWIKSRNRFGYYDAPLQVKMFWTGSRVHVQPFIFAPSGNDTAADAEQGGGTLAELVVNRRTVVGMTAAQGASQNGDRRTLGAYLRLGFGRWGVLAEHDITERAPVHGPAPFVQNVTYGQAFLAVREWLVASAAAERLDVEQLFAARQVAGKVELAARLASQASLGISARWQQDQQTGRAVRSITLQAAFKTVP